VRVVLDTNVLLAAIATHGLCQALVTLVFRDHVVILSEHILGEVAKHYRGKFKATKRQADAAVAVLRANGEIVEPVTVPLGTVRDKDDLPVLGTAVAGSAAVLVTGDQELLVLGLFRGVAILSPRDFYERLRG
jgi:putative PIN family toxin of toxin-antitoxin system